MSDEADRLAKAFRRVLRRVRPLEGSDELFRQDPVHIRFAEQRCRGIVLGTKGFILRVVRLFPFAAGTLDVLTRYGLPQPADIEFVVRWVRHRDVPVRFVGDLDGVDLATFLAFRAGLRAEGLELPHASPRWMEMCRSSNPDMFSAVDDEADPFERELMTGLLSLPVDWAEVVGGPTVEFLQSGMKIEQEGLTNFAGFGVSDEAEATRRDARWHRRLVRTLCETGRDA